MQRGVKEREHYWFPLSPYYLHHLSVTTHIMVSFHTYHWLIQNITKSLRVSVGHKYDFKTCHLKLRSTCSSCGTLSFVRSSLNGPFF